MQVELNSLRLEKQQWREDLETECHRWNSELDALRIANARQIELQDELSQKSVELEGWRHQRESHETIQNEIIKKTGEVEVRNQVQDAVLQQTLEKLKANAPQRLKDLRDECAALKAKDKERLALKEEVVALRVETSRCGDEIKDLREASRKLEMRLGETTEELERKKAELLNMRAEREVLRTGEVLRQELVDENMTMKEELDKLKRKDATSRKDLQDQLSRACEELNDLRAQHDDTTQAAWQRQKKEGQGVVTV